jgi:hypothetical protein
MRVRRLRPRTYARMNVWFYRCFQEFDLMDENGIRTDISRGKLKAVLTWMYDASFTSDDGVRVSELYRRVPKFLPHGITSVQLL